MEGLVNFGQQCALILALLLPTFMYVGAIGLFLFAAWGLWQQAQPHNPFRGKPWIPIASLLMSGACASFPVILNKVDISAGSSVKMSVVDGLTSYTATDTTGILGSTPAETVLNIVQAFEGFFQVFGAMTCLFAMFAWHSGMTGRSNRRWTGCAVQFVFGILLINIYTVSEWLVGFFST